LPPDRLANTYATWAVLILPYLEQDAVYREWDVELRYFEQTDRARKNNIPVYFCPSRRAAPRGRFSINDDRTNPTAYPDTPGGLSDYASCNGNGDEAGRKANGALIISMPNGIEEDGDEVNSAFARAPTGTRITDWQSWTSLGSILDGTTNTLLIGEKHLRPPALRRPGSGEDRSVFNGGRAVAYRRWAGRGTDGDLRPLAQPGDTVLGNQRFGGPHPSLCQFVLCDGSVRAIRLSVHIDTLTRLAARDDGQVVSGSDF
jgi:hypothetical protein